MASPTGSESWCKAPLFRREVLCKLQATQTQLDLLRRECHQGAGPDSAAYKQLIDQPPSAFGAATSSNQDAGLCTVWPASCARTAKAAASVRTAADLNSRATANTSVATDTHHVNYVEEFIRRYQAMLPCLGRVQWVASCGPIPRHNNVIDVYWQEAHTEKHSKLSSRPETNHSPDFKTDSINRFALHFHSMGPGRWSMACWGEPPNGYGWGIAICPLLRKVTAAQGRNCPSGSKRLGILRRVRITDICFKPHVKPERFKSAEVRWPVLLLQSTDNPLGLPFRCIDGKHRIHRLLADACTQLTPYSSPCPVGIDTAVQLLQLNAIEVNAIVLTVDEIASFVVGLPLCTLPPVDMCTGHALEDDIGFCGVEGALRHLGEQNLISLARANDKKQT